MARLPSPRGRLERAGPVEKRQHFGNRQIERGRDLVVQIQLRQHVHERRILVDGDVVLTRNGEDALRE